LHKGAAQLGRHADVIYRFGDCALDADRRELRRSGVPCPLEPQVFDLLEFLIRNRDRVVSKEDVFNVIWRGRIVSEAVLHTQLSAVRRAIGDTGSGQRLIRTLRNKGFRFVGQVREDTRTKRAVRFAEESRNRALLADHPTIPVLPFANISGDPALESLADGFTEELITALSKVGWLYVATRVSSFACKGQALATAQVARKLGVRYLLAGALRQEAGCRRITVQLIDAIADRQIWAERYDGGLIERLTVQDKICEQVVAAIEPQLYIAEQIRIARKSPANLNTWECVVRALSLMNSRDRQKVALAQAFLRKAVAIDPNSAQCHSLLSIATTLRVHMSWAHRQTVIPAALASAHKALSLNPDEPWAHAALGYALIWKRPEDAIVPCQSAVKLDPNFAAGHYFMALGSAYAGYHDRIFPHAAMAERLARRDLLARAYAGAHDNVRATGSFAIGHYRQGVEFARSAAVYIPNSPTAYRALLMNLALAGETDGAKHALQTLRHLAPAISQNWIRQNAVWTSDDAMKRYVEAFRIAGLK
jgi:TolB-like protein/Flp pilus assembly protein TadD